MSDSKIITGQGQLLKLVSPKDNLSKRKSKYNFSNTSTTTRKPDAPQLKSAYLNSVYNNSSFKATLTRKPQNVSELGFASNFCLLGDSLYSSQGRRATVRSFGGAIPSSLKSGKLFSQEYALASYVEPPGTKRAIIKSKEDSQKTRKVVGSYSRSTVSDSTFKCQDTVKAMLAKTTEKGNDNKELIEVINKVKGLIQNYQVHEQELINKNEKLREEISLLETKLHNDNP